MGKRQIGEMQPFEFIVTLIIADLACIPMADVSIPLIYGLVAVLTLFVLHQATYLLEQSGSFLKRLISGKPSVVINKNGVDLKELKKNNLGVDDLIESMRSLGYFSFDDLDYAIFESNGKLSPFENQSKNEEKGSLPIVLINNKKFVAKNLEIIKSNEKEFTKFLKNSNCALKDVEILTIDGNGRVYLKAKNKKYQILSFTHAEGVKW